MNVASVKKRGLKCVWIPAKTLDNLKALKMHRLQPIYEVIDALIAEKYPVKGINPPKDDVEIKN